MRFQSRRLRRLLVGVSIALNLALLAGSRHMPWFLTARHGATTWDWVFPLGLSFYVFQALTYTIDLYRRDAEGTTSLLAHLSAVSFFPTLLAGPITRVSELVKEFAAEAILSRSAGAQALRSRSVARGLRLLGPTLLRFFRLHGNRARHGYAARHSPAN